MGEKPLPWIQVASDLAENDKYRGYSVRCGLDHLQALGALVTIWTWFARRYPTGRSPRKKFDIAAILNIAEEPAVTVFKTLQRVGLVEVVDEEVILHDWEEWAGKAIHNRKRQRKFWEQKKNAEQTFETGGGVEVQTFETIPVVEVQTFGTRQEVKKQTFGGDKTATSAVTNVCEGTYGIDSDVTQTFETTQTTTDNNKDKSLKEKGLPGPDSTEQPDCSSGDPASTPPAACSSPIGEYGKWGPREIKESTNLLLKCGIPPHTAARYSREYHPNRIIRQVERFIPKRNTLKNPTGFLLTAIEKDYR